MATEPLIEELREAKVDALRADLGRIHAVSSHNHTSLPEYLY
jgi:hypothetical protein